MPNTAPLTSTTGLAGYVPNVTNYGQTSTFPEWVKVTTEWLASRWAYGEQILPQGWDPARYGTPNPEDTNGVVSPRTLLAFSQYAADYQPGKDPEIDKALPYIPPGPNDYIEDPITTATRIATEQADRQLQFQYEQLGYNYAVLDENKKQAARQALLDQFGQELDLYAIQSGQYQADELNKIRRYETDASIYQTQEGIRSANLQQAGGLSATLQGLYDARTQNAINLAANPQDLVAREYAVRALQEPPATNVPGYTNVDTLGEVIRKLIDYQPTAAPTPPAPGQAPAPPIREGLSQVYNPEPEPTTFTGWQPSPGASFQTLPEGSQPGTQSGPQSGPQVDTTNSSGWSSRLRDAYAKHGVQSFARGTLGTSARQMVIGDPQADGRPNPEMVQVHNPGKNTRVQVTPLKSAMRMMKGVRHYAYGTDAPNVNLKSYSDEAYQNFPTLAYAQGRMSKAKYNTLATGLARGAFGTEVPESGSLNYARYLDIAKDPEAAASLSSFYNAANRSLASTVAQAKARAPLGQAIQTSLIRT